MTRISDLQYLRLSKWQKLIYKLKLFFAVSLPGFFVSIGKAIAGFFVSLGKAIAGECRFLTGTFASGSWKTRLSYLVMGFKNLANGQILRGILFLFAEAVFIFYMITTGGYWLSMLPSLGKLGPTKEYNLVLDVYTTTYHDNSFKILLYGVLTVFFINIWIGIPYLMLITTGILMNIPADLYESARIDGASGWQQYSKITLPYMLFVTGPYLLTSFTGNMNNFNVIYLLTGGAPTNNTAIVSGTVGYTDLLITWLFKITTGAESQYYMASIIGILVFLVVAIISLIVYNLLPSIKNEEDFQ